MADLFIGEHLSEFQQKIAMTWAHVNMIEWQRIHPVAPPEEKERAFLELIDQGICVALKMRVDYQS